jgi:4-carboxymuconolactone decarboxylase
LIDELKSGSRPASMSEEEAAVFDFTTELMTARTVSDATFERAKRLFREQQIVDLTSVVGTYVTIAMLLEMAKQGVPDGATLPFGN